MLEGTMLLHEMNYVYEVYRQRSFTKAAQALYIAQPSLSQMVRKAEARIGAPIFDRSTSPIGVTELGRAYIRAAEQVLQIEADLQQYLDDTEKCLTGALTLGGTTFFTSYVLPPLVSAYSERYPGVELRLHEAHTGQLKQELQEGTLDFALDNTLLDPATYEAVEIQTEQVILAVPRALPVNEKAAAFRLSAKELPQAGAPCVPLELFADTPFLLLKEGNDTRRRAEQLCAQAGFEPKIRLALDQQLAAYNLAGYGLGAAFISDTLALSAPPDERLCFYRIDSPDATRSISLFYKRTRALTAPMRALRTMLKPPEGEERVFRHKIPNA